MTPTTRLTPQLFQYLLRAGAKSKYCSAINSHSHLSNLSLFHSLCRFLRHYPHLRLRKCSGLDPVHSVRLIICWLFLLQKIRGRIGVTSSRPFVKAMIFFNVSLLLELTKITSHIPQWLLLPVDQDCLGLLTSTGSSSRTSAPLLSSSRRTHRAVNVS